MFGGVILEQISINIDILVLVISIIVLLIFISLKVTKNFLNRTMLIVSILAGSFFTSIGLIINYQDNYDYIISYFLFFFSMILFLIKIISKKSFKDRLNINNLFIKYKKIFIILGILSLLLQLSSLIYPNFKLFDLFTLPTYRANTNVFQEKIANKNNLILWGISVFKVMFYPFFFIWLYTLKKKPIKFISLFLFYHYIDFVNNQYISRSALIVYLVFIWLYLCEEKILSRKLLISVAIFSVGIVIPLMNILEVIRMGNSVVGEKSLLDNIKHLIYQEGYCQQFLEVSDSFSSQLGFGKYLLFGISSPLFFLPDVDFPVLSYAFTERILGLSYGSDNYYVMLPGAFGEGLMIFGKYLVWCYGLFIASFVGISFRIFTKYSFLKFWAIMYILDFSRAFRGGIQTFFISTINTSLLLITILIILYFINNSKRLRR